MKYLRYLWAAIFFLCLWLAIGYLVTPLSVAFALWLGYVAMISLLAVNARVAGLESDLNAEQKKLREVLDRHEELIARHEELIRKNEELIELVRWQK